MKQIYLVRHCKAEGQDPTAKLTDEGKRQALLLADLLKSSKIDSIVTSPFTRAIDSILPLCDVLELDYKVDSRLEEKLLSSKHLDNWMELLEASYEDLDLVYEGGESSRQAMSRGIEVIKEMMNGPSNGVVVVTHGALMSLILKHFDNRIGYEEWRNLTNPDVYLVRIDQKETLIERIWK